MVMSSSTAAGASSALADDTTTTEGVLSRDQVAQLLHVIPTFTLVDRQGVPFMVVGEDAKVTGFFFTSYSEAARILKVASDSAETAIKQAIAERQPDADTLTNPWKLARISTIPLDAAVSLSLKAGGGSSNIRNYFQVAAAASDIEDALAVTGKDELAEGKVPLFYYEDFKLDNSTSPVYFSKPQLEAAYRQAHPGQQVALPEPKTTELFALLTALVQQQPPSHADNADNDELATVVLVAPPDSARRARECAQRGGGAPPFVLGQRILVL